jgi:magnesium transporter
MAATAEPADRLRSTRLVRPAEYARPSLASHLIDARGTVEPNVDPKGVESRLRDGIFLWLDIDSPTEDDFKLLRDVFKLHPLALEDSRKFGQRPKLDSYDDFTLLVVFGAVDDPTRRSGLAPIEVHCFYSEKWLITVHKGECAVFEELRNQTHRQLKNYEEGLGILYLVVDTLVDSFLPQLTELDDEFDELEDTVLTDPQPASLQQAITMKRQLVQLRKIVNPQRDMFGAILSGRYELPGMTPEHERYFRDIYDHLIRVAEQLDDYRDLASGITDLYQSTVGNKMNLTMKQLGWVATFFLPLSFLTGFFGQNFTLLVGKLISPGWTFWVLGLGLDLAAFVAVLLWYLNSERGNLRLRMPTVPPLPHRR